MAKPHTTTARSKDACLGCSVEIGMHPGVRVQPTDVDGELFCPVCFCYKRVPLEPDRFVAHAFMPVLCGKCHSMTVAVGKLACGGCGSPSAVVIPPKPKFRT